MTNLWERFFYSWYQNLKFFLLNLTISNTPRICNRIFLQALHINFCNCLSNYWMSKLFPTFCLLINYRRTRKKEQFIQKKQQAAQSAQQFIWNFFLYIYLTKTNEHFIPCWQFGKNNTCSCKQREKRRCCAAEEKISVSLAVILPLVGVNWS